MNSAFCFLIWQEEQDTETKFNPVAPRDPGGPTPPPAPGAHALALGLPVDGAWLCSGNDIASVIFIYLFI